MPIPNAEGQLYFATGIDNTGLMRGKQQAVGIISSMASQISRKDVFAGLAIGAGIAFAKISKETKNFSEEFEHSMKEVETISAAVQGNFEGFSDKIVGMSTGVPQSANELSEAFYQIVSAGYDGAAGMELLKVAAEGAVGGVSDVKTVADGYTTAMNAWKISTAESAKVSDIFFNTVKLGKTTIGELSSNIAQVAPLASAYKVGMDQIFSATATLTKQGTPTAQAMTQIRSALIGVNEVLGQGWSETMTFQEALVEVSRQAEETGTDLKEFIGGRVEGVLGVLAMTGENAKMAAEDLRSYGDAAGAAGKAFDTLKNDSINVSKTLHNNIKAALKPLGDFLAGKSTEFAKKMNEAFASGDIEKFAKYLGVAASAMVAYSVATKAATISKINFLRAVVRAKNAMLAFNVATKANPIGLIAAGLAAATTAFIAFRNRTAEATKEYKEFLSNKATAEKEFEGLFRVLENAKKGTDEYRGAIEQINTKYGDYLDNLLTEKSTLEDIKTAQEEARDAMVDRLATAAKEAAIQEERAKLVQKEVEIQSKLYKKAEKLSGSSTAALAVNEFSKMVDDFQDLGEKFGRAQRSGMQSFATELRANMEKLKTDFASTYLGGDGDFVEKLVLDVILNENDLELAEQKINALYSQWGDVPGVKNTGEGDGDGGDDGDGSGVLDIKAIKEEIAEAKKAYAEWEEFKNTSQADVLRAEYDHYLKVAGSYEGYLSKKLIAYQGSSDAIIAIVKEQAKLEVAEAKTMGEWSKQVDESNEERIDKAVDALDELMDAWIDATEESIQKSIQAEEAADKDKVQRAEDVARAVQEIRERYEYSTRSESHKGEYKKQLAALNKYYNDGLILHEEYEGLKVKMSHEYTAESIDIFLNGLGKISNGVSDLFHSIDEGAAESMDKMLDLINNIGQAVGSYYSGDYEGMISSILSGIGSIYELINDAKNAEAQLAVEQLSMQFDNFNQNIEIGNMLLEDRIRLLNGMVGINWYAGSTGVLEDMNYMLDYTLEQFNALDHLTNKMTEVGYNIQTGEKLYLNKDGKKEDIDTSQWGLDEWKKALDGVQEINGQIIQITDEQQRAAIISMISEYQYFLDQIQAMTDEYNQRLTGTTSSAITDSIIDGFANGKLYMRDFADDFEGLMKQAIINSFETKYLEKQMDGWYDMFVDLSEDGISNPDIAALRNEYAAIIENASTIWGAMTMSYGDLFDTDLAISADDPNSLSGAIRRDLTEETGTLLAGRMNTMMLDVRVIAEHMTVAADCLAKIEYNTSFNHHLADIRYGIDRINDKLN